MIHSNAVFVSIEPMQILTVKPAEKEGEVKGSRVGGRRYLPCSQYFAILDIIILQLRS